jgi:hypothetical protein
MEQMVDQTKMEQMLERLMAKWDVTHHKMDAKIDKLGDGQEETKTAMNSLWSKLEETIKTRMESALASVNQQTQGLYGSSRRLRRHSGMYRCPLTHRPEPPRQYNGRKEGPSDRTRHQGPRTQGQDSRSRSSI